MKIVQAKQFEKGMCGILTTKQIEDRKKKIKPDEKEDEPDEIIDISDSSSSLEDEDEYE